VKIIFLLHYTNRLCVTGCADGLLLCGHWGPHIGSHSLMLRSDVTIQQTVKLQIHNDADASYLYRWCLVISTYDCIALVGLSDNREKYLGKQKLLCEIWVHHSGDFSNVIPYRLVERNGHFRVTFFILNRGTLRLDWTASHTRQQQSFDTLCVYGNGEMKQSVWLASRS
jgi:hypothetical protein